MSKEKIYLVTDPDGDKFAFDTEDAAKKFVIKQVKKYDILDDEYIDYVKHLMEEEPYKAPSSYHTFINEMLQANGDMENFEYFIEDLILNPEDDIT